MLQWGTGRAVLPAAAAHHRIKQSVPSVCVAERSKLQLRGRQRHIRQLQIDRVSVRPGSCLAFFFAARYSAVGFIVPAESLNTVPFGNLLMPVLRTLHSRKRRT